MTPDLQGPESGEGTVWVRRRAESQEAWMAGAIALVAGAAVGGTVLYLARMFIAREELRMRPMAEKEGAGG